MTPSSYPEYTTSSYHSGDEGYDYTNGPPEESRINSNRIVSGHGRQQQQQGTTTRVPYQPEYPSFGNATQQQDRHHDESRPNSNSNLFNQGQNTHNQVVMDVPRYPSNYPRDGGGQGGRPNRGAGVTMSPNRGPAVGMSQGQQHQLPEIPFYPNNYAQDPRQGMGDQMMMNNHSHGQHQQQVPNNSTYHNSSYSSQGRIEQDRLQSSPQRRQQQYTTSTGPTRTSSSASWMNQQQQQPQQQQQQGHQQRAERPSGSVAGGSASRPNSVSQMPELSQPLSPEIKEEYKAVLARQGFSTGLAKALIENVQSFHYRIWVVDNSGSMQIGDGHRVNNGKVIPVSRWEEIQDTVLYHSQMAGLLSSYTRFRLLNNPPRSNPGSPTTEFAVGAPGADVHAEIQNARLVMGRTRADGVTPLTQHIRDIKAEIQDLLPELTRSGKRVAVILATDGLPTDEQGYGGPEITNAFIQALNGLVGLPVWLVIRLCTDEDDVTDFYNQLDGKLEMSLEVLDDFLGEYKEVRQSNPWLNYALPLHRCRELGYHDRIFDLIDERPLTKGELRDFCVLLFGTEYRLIPDPVVDWKSFLKYVQAHLEKEQPQWNPNNAKKEPWINVKKLHRIYGGGTCSIM